MVFLKTELLTQNLESKDVLGKPFPFVSVDNALSQDLYDSLVDSMPPLDVLIKGLSPGNNDRFNYSAANIAFNPDIAFVWKEFCQAHLNQPFLDDLLRLFAPHILSNFPDFESRFKPVAELRSGIRGADEETNADVLLDFQISINTPVQIAGTSVRGPHVDNPRKLFVGLFYMRHPEDKARGGDLQLCCAKTPDLKLDASRSADMSCVEPVVTVPYKANSLVLFLNTPESLHSVTPRSATPYPRIFLNILAQMQKPLFKLTGSSSSDYDDYEKSGHAHYSKRPNMVVDPLTLPFFVPSSKGSKK